MSDKTKSLLFTLLLLITLPLLPAAYKVEANRQQPTLIMLESTERVFDQERLKVLAPAFTAKGQQIYSLGTDTEGVISYDPANKRSRGMHPAAAADALAVGPQEQLYLADTSANEVQVLSPTGQKLNTFRVPHPVSLGALSTGNLVVASSASGKLLRVLSPTGRTLGVFGEMNRFDANNPKENSFLNRGEVVVGPSDTIYYVSRYAPAPTVRKFSSGGQLLLEFAVEGASIDYQLGVLNRFLREKEDHVIGGYDVITSAAVDPSTGHLWIGMNGTSQAGVVYEYSPGGVKLREYAFRVKGTASDSGVITGVKDIVVRSPWIYLLTWEGRAYRFNLNNPVAAARQGEGRVRSRGPGAVSRASFVNNLLPAPATPRALPQLPCPTAQPLTCVVLCRAGASPSSEDCGAEVSRHAAGDTIIGGSCSSSAGPEPSCSASANLCSPSTGTRTTVSTSLTCTAPSSGGGGGETGGGECFEECPRFWVCYNGLCLEGSPIIVDTSGDGFDLTDAAGGVDFDINGNGTRERLSWTSAGSDDAWLGLDRNANGVIDSGRELFGNFSPQPDPPPGEIKNGFLALAEYDKPGNGGNGDGVISADDAIFFDLCLWRDANHNGISEPNELRTLPEMDVTWLSVSYKESKKTDQYGNQFRYRAKLRDAQGAQVGRWAWDVFLLLAQ